MDPQCYHQCAPAPNCGYRSTFSSHPHFFGPQPQQRFTHPSYGAPGLNPNAHFHAEPNEGANPFGPHFVPYQNAPPSQPSRASGTGASPHGHPTQRSVDALLGHISTLDMRITELKTKSKSNEKLTKSILDAVTVTITETKADLKSERRRFAGLTGRLRSMKQTNDRSQRQIYRLIARRIVSDIAVAKVSARLDQDSRKVSEEENLITLEDVPQNVAPSVSEDDDSLGTSSWSSLTASFSIPSTPPTQLKKSSIEETKQDHQRTDQAIQETPSDFILEASAPIDEPTTDTLKRDLQYVHFFPEYDEKWRTAGRVPKDRSLLKSDHNPAKPPKTLFSFENSQSAGQQRSADQDRLSRIANESVTGKSLRLAQRSAADDQEGRTAIPVTSKPIPPPASEYWPYKSGSLNIWDSARQREGAVRLNTSSAGYHDLRFPEFFRHGIRYVPDDNESAVHRAVIIDNIPRRVTNKEMLDKVRGGLLISGRLMDTTSITGYKTAFITFVRAFSAASYVDYIKSHPLQFHDQPAKVSLVSTATYPLAMKTKKAVFEHGHTRCLLIRNTLGEISTTALAVDIQVHASIKFDSVEHYELQGPETLLVRFTSVTNAGLAYGRLTSFERYQHLRVSFGPDPCALPVETLSDQEKEGE